MTRLRMLRTFLFSIQLSTIFVASQNHQITLGSSVEETILNTRLNFSSPAPNIFSSVHGLLRQGYNTYFSNGFSIAPCEIPAFTPLYHGWLNEDPPDSPEWLAATPDMAYGIMGSTRNSFMFTYQTTRTTKCLYFDGASGQLGENGTMDTQMLFLYGNTTGPPGKKSDSGFLWDEYARAQGLCNWLREHNLDAPGQGIESIIRMSAGFEIIWCNFSSPSISLVSKLNVTVSSLGYNRTTLGAKSSKHLNKNVSDVIERPLEDLPAPDWEIDWDHEPFVLSQQWDWFTSSSRVYNVEDLASVREPSIRLIDGDIVSLYSQTYGDQWSDIPQRDRGRFELTGNGLLQRGLTDTTRRETLTELSRRRSGHRVGSLSPEQVTTFRQEMLDMVSRVTNLDVEDAGTSRPVQWIHTADLIVDRFAKRLARLRDLLIHSSDAELSESARSFILLREQLHALLMPFFQYSIFVTEATSHQWQDQNADASLRRCVNTYLPSSLHQGSQQPISKDSRQHHTDEAFGEVLTAICSTLITIGSSVEVIWLRDFNDDPGQTTPKALERVAHSMQKWRESIEELMAWLGWVPHWMGCDRLCAWDEECYIPVWPTLRQMDHRMPAYGNNRIDPEEVEWDLWHPRCLKREEFAAN